MSPGHGAVVERRGERERNGGADGGGVADDQDRRQAVGAHEVAVAEDLERLAPLVPALAIVTRVGSIRSQGRYLGRSHSQHEGKSPFQHASIVPDFRRRSLTSLAERAK